MSAIVRCPRCKAPKRVELANPQVVDPQGGWFVDCGPWEFCCASCNILFYVIGEKR